MLKLSSDISEIKGVGPKKAAGLNSVGIKSVIDILRIVPTRYQDLRSALALDKLSGVDFGLFKAKLVDLKVNHIRKNMAIVVAQFEDHKTTTTARWFNKKYLLRQLVKGKYYYLTGPVSLFGGSYILVNPEVEVFIENEPLPDTLTPVYSSNSRLSAASISPKSLRNIIKKLLEVIDWSASFSFNNQHQPFKKIEWAFKQLHNPVDLRSADKALKTIAFLEQVLFQIGVLERRKKLTQTYEESRTCRDFEVDYDIPFCLTSAQKRTVNEIASDLLLNKSLTMNRLVQGDVGCGKTMVAFICMRLFNEAGSGQCCFMAPTEVLAWQQYNSFCRFFPEQKNNAAILTGKHKQNLKVNNNSIISAYVFGTHALFQDSVRFENLGFCIIDEQQRFGVAHRKCLVNKGYNAHQLLLSATPIPRTLSLTIFGDMDTSIIDELPPGRKPIKTRIVSCLEQVADDVIKTVKKTNQVYIVCPLIEDSLKIDKASVMATASKVEGLFPDLKYEIITGKTDWKEKQAVMQRFKAKKTDIIISTTVIEVGVDNPNATMMIIENAEQFGLSQLHQLRGRVGRGSDSSECVLISPSQSECERLQILQKTTDGFELAIEDLKMRGPGDLLGTRQSGLSHPCFSHSIGTEMIQKSRKRALEILTKTDKTVRDWFVVQMKLSFGDAFESFMEGG